MINYPIEVIDGNEYLRVCSSAELLNKKGIKVHYDDSDEVYEVAIFRIDNQLFCVQNHCPHQHAPEIFNGVLDNCVVTCPLHGWSYNLKDGLNMNPRQGLRSLQTFEVIERDGYIYIENPKIEIPNWRR